MKTTMISILMGSVLAFAAPVMAEEMKTENKMQTSKVLENLASQGFNIVSKIEYKNGEYVARVINGEGRAGTLKFNPQTDKIEKPNLNNPGLTALDVAKKVEDAGYYNITEINTEWLNDKYKVTALDKAGAKTNLVVDALTGNITK
jgi:hypothetical protein